VGKRLTRLTLDVRVNFYPGERVGIKIKNAIVDAIKIVKDENIEVVLKIGCFEGPDYLLTICRTSTLEEELTDLVRCLKVSHLNEFVLSLFSLRKYKEKE